MYQMHKSEHLHLIPGIHVRGGGEGSQMMQSPTVIPTLLQWGGRTEARQSPKTWQILQPGVHRTTEKPPGDTLTQQGGRQDQTPKICLLTTSNMLGHLHAHTHIHTQTEKYSQEASCLTAVWEPFQAADLLKCS